MQKDSRFFDDFAKLASGAAGTFTDLKREVEGMVMDKMEKIMTRMHLVRREEFEVVRQMAEQARAEQENLTKKLAELEKLLELQGSKPAMSKKQLKE